MLNQDRRARTHAHQQIADEQSAQAYSRQAAEIASTLSTAAYTTHPVDQVFREGADEVAPCFEAFGVSLDTAIVHPGRAVAGCAVSHGRRHEAQLHDRFDICGENAVV
jgi:hypothetical protein